MAVEMGVADPERIGIIGHSHGGLMVANLLAHTDLFRAGIARSGSYNKTNQPFGFQSERRSLFEARDQYIELRVAEGFFQDRALAMAESGVVVGGLQSAAPQIDAQPAMRRLSLPVMTAFGVGQAAEGIKSAAFNTFLLFFYQQVLGLPGTFTGIALAIALVFDAVTDPVAGSARGTDRGRFTP